MDTTSSNKGNCAGYLIFLAAVFFIGVGAVTLNEAYYDYTLDSHRENSNEHSYTIDFIMPSFFLLSGVGILIWGIRYWKLADKENKIRLQEEEERKQEEEERKQKEKDDYNRKIEGYEQKYGGITTCIRFSGEIPDEKEFIAFEDTKTLVIAGSAYNFKDIIDAELTIDEGGVLQTFKTKSSLGGAVGRAVVGGVIAGPAGAVIGGTTGSKKTETVAVEKKPDKYIVAITVNKLSNPIVKCDCQENKDAAYNIMAILKVILNNR